MKTLKNITAMFLLISLTITGSSVMAQKRIEKVLAQKEFKVVDNATLQIDHKYGKIVCKNHDLNSVTIKVTASLETKDPEKADKIFDKINLTINGDELKIRIISEFSEKLTGKNDNLNVDLEVFLPESMNLEISQMFGNTFIENISGQASIENRYGTLQVNALRHSNNDIQVSFGNANLGAVEGGKVKISYGDLSIKKAGHIQLDSEYSNITITEVLSVLAKHEGGALKIGTIDSFDVISKFSDCEVGKLNKSLKAKSEYGSFKAEHVSADFSAIEFTNSFGSGTLIFDQKANFKFDAEMSFCDLKYPEKITNLSEKVTTSFKNSYKGKMGTAANPGSTVQIKSSYGDVDFKTKQ